MTSHEGFQFGTSRKAAGSNGAGAIGVAAGLLMAGALACGQADELDGSPGGNGGSGAVGGANAAGGDAAGGNSGDPVVVPPEAPECMQGGHPSFIEVSGLGSARSQAFDGHVVGQGLGLPAGVSELQSGADSPDDVGWLQLEGAAPADAGADAGNAPVWTIVGPREIAEMSAPAGELHVRQERTLAPSYRSQHFEVVVTRGERVVLFQQVTESRSLGDREGFLLELGAPICQRATQQRARNGASCFYDYSHALEVTVPGGASATLALGEARTVGDYRLLHGSTNRLTAATSFNQGGGECNDIKASPSQFTAILLPSAP